MPTPKFQFSLRSLMLFTLFVAVLCSIGVCTDWVVSAVIAGGGIAGSIVRRSWLGFLQGIVEEVCGRGCQRCVLLLGTVKASIFWVPPWQLTVGMKIGAFIGSLIGGVFGGLARYRSSRL